MSDFMQAVPVEAPVMKAWEAYKCRAEYANTRKWALDTDHVDGSLWAAFYAGFMACAMERASTAADELEAAAEARGRGSGLREAAEIAKEALGGFEAVRAILVRAAEVEKEDRNG